MESIPFQMVMSEKWSNAIALYMGLDWGLKTESLNPPYAEFISPKTKGRVKFEIYFTNMFKNQKDTFCISTENIDTSSIGNSHYVVLCIWNKSNDNCVVLSTEDARMLMDNKSDSFLISDMVPKIKRKFSIGINKMEDADLPDDLVS